MVLLKSTNNSSTYKLAPVSTFTGKYTAGDTRTNHVGAVKVDTSSDAWQAGFDRIDIAPKDNRLSVEEICAKRDKEASFAKFMFWTNPANWKPANIKEFNESITQEELLTEYYRNNN